MKFDKGGVERALDALRLSERQWDVLTSRLAVGRKASTLEETAIPFGVTRERIRQIQRKASDKIIGAYSRGALYPVLRALEEAELEPPATMSRATELRWVQQALGEPAVSPNAAERVAVAVRCLVVGGSPRVVDRWPRATYRVCSLLPLIREHPIVAAHAFERHQTEVEANRHWTYQELAEFVLGKAGKPLHWREIRDRAEKVGRRDFVGSQTLLGALQARPDKFVRAAAGTYGLTEWGGKPAIPYPDLIAGLLATAGHPMSFGELQAKVNAAREIKRASLVMFLGMHPRFYESITGLFGLRSWLPEPHRQTLRTSPDYIEDTKSAERVRRSETHGYDVRRIVTEDRAPPGK